MGEAKRRKKLDPNYGKSKPMVELTVLNFACEMYRQYGKGIVYLHHWGVGYVLPNHTDLSDVDRALMDDVDCETTFVVTMLMSGSLFATGIFNRSENIFESKLRISADWAVNSSAFVYQ